MAARLLWWAAALLVSHAHSTAINEYVVHVRAPHGGPLAAATADHSQHHRRETEGATREPDGSAAAPFPTIEGARDHLRSLRSAGGDDERQYRVVIGRGTYTPLRLEPQDSGSRSDPPVIYEADPSDGPAIISGGTQVPKGAFKPWVGHSGVLTADISSLNL
eukprot:COSAG05_NODE_9389_length_627_cov_1.155303_1_plen_161_part_01